MKDKITNPTLMRVMLVKREVCRVTADWQGLRVRSGRAWVSLKGSDLILSRGQEIPIDLAKKDVALVSAVGQAPLVMELLGEAPRRPAADPRPAMSAAR
jgi:hypothetical protein